MKGSGVYCRVGVFWLIVRGKTKLWLGAGIVGSNTAVQRPNVPVHLALGLPRTDRTDPAG